MTRAYNGTILIATPTFLRLYMARCTPEQFASLSLVATGAEPLRPDLIDAFEARFGIRPFEGYGATETSPAIAFNTPPERAPGHSHDLLKEGTVGRPIEEVTVEVRDRESGKVLPVGQEGLIWVNGPNVMLGYLDEPALTAQVVVDGWYDTRDIGFLDDGGFLSITGRASQFSKIGGEMIPHLAHRSGDRRIARAHANAEAPIVAVTAVPDTRKGERIVVHPHPYLDDPGPDRRRLAHRRPAAAVYPLCQTVSSPSICIPVLSTGKVDLGAVRAIALERFAPASRSLPPTEPARCTRGYDFQRPILSRIPANTRASFAGGAMPAPKETYDAIVIGGGHNGLVAAAYLAKSGFHTLVLERYREIGGAAFSQEIEPGFLLSEGSYVLSLMPRSIIDELDAWGGIELIERDPRFFMPFPDGRALTAWEDHDAFIAEIARFSEKDARAYDHYDAFVEKAAEVMDRYILINPPSFAEFAANFKSTEDARIFQKMILGSVAEVAEYFFESAQVQAMACALGLIGTFRGPRDAGTAYVKLYHAMGMATGKRGAWAYVRGAMGSVTQALANAARRFGVEIRTDAEVDQVCVANGRATGVVTNDGEEFHREGRPLERRPGAHLSSSWSTRSTCRRISGAISRRSRSPHR